MRQILQYVAPLRFDAGTTISVFQPLPNPMVASLTPEQIEHALNEQLKVEESIDVAVDSVWASARVTPKVEHAVSRALKAFFVSCWHFSAKPCELHGSPVARSLGDTVSRP
jgi:hypothetical protein